MTIEENIIKYYNQNKLRRFNMNKMIKTINEPMITIIHAYNDLQRRGLLITAYDNNGQSYMIEANSESIGNVVDYFHHNREYLNEIAKRLGISIKELAWYYCQSLGMKLAEYQKISHEF